MKIAPVGLAFLSVAGAAVAQPLPENSSREIEPVFVTEKDDPNRAYLSIGGWGPLSMDANGCLVVGERSLVIWSADTQVSRTEDGRIQVTDGASGKIVYVGETIGLGGGSGPGPYPNDRLAEPIPEACAGLPWSMGAYLETAEEVRENQMAEAKPWPITVPEGSSLITEWNEENIFEETRLLLTQFGNRIYDIEFVNEPTAHVVVKLTGDSAVPSAHHQFGSFYVEARFETGATERMGEVVDGMWERYAQPRVSELPTTGVAPGQAVRPTGVPEGPAGWGEPSEPDTAQLGRRIRRDYDDRLAGMWVGRGPHRVIVRLTGDEPVPNELQQIYGFAVEVQYRVGAPHTFAELQAALTEGSEAIQQYLPTAHARFVDERTGELVIAVDFGDEVAKRNADALSAELGVPVRITEEERSAIQLTPQQR